MMSVVTHLLAVGIGVLIASAYLLPIHRRREAAAELRGTRLRVISHTPEEAFRHHQGAQ